MTTLGMILIVLALITLVIGIFEGKPWQKAVNIIAVFLVAYYACGCYWWKVFAISPGKGVLFAVGILIVSMILAIYIGISNAAPPEKSPNEEATATNEDEDLSGKCQGCHLAYECRGGDPKTCQTSK